ncbi:MAG: MoaD/ThiS family protein [Bacillota bacterium]|nr:MoaD/ThiS family protein [Bacillota bacterium]
MINITVKGVAEVGKLLQTKGKLEIKLPEGTSIGELLNILADKYGKELVTLTRTDQGEKTLRILINGRDITFLKGLETELGDGDHISILPLLSGG